MSASEALLQAREAGVRVRIDGDHLALEASAPPQAGVLDILARYKADILYLLRPADDGWSAEDWREYYEERAGVAEFNGGLSREQAEKRAYDCCVGKWLHLNPVRSAPSRCHHCGKPGGLLFPYLTGDKLRDPWHTWLHQECSSDWHNARKMKAVSVLFEMGISNSNEISNNFGKKT